MKTVCVQCNAHMGGDPSDPVISHGMCRNCFEIEVKEIEEINDEVQRKLSAVRGEDTPVCQTNLRGN